MDQVFASIKNLIHEALNAAGEVAGGTLDTAAGALDLTQNVYEYLCSRGMSSSDAADLTEVLMRELIDKLEESLR